MRSSDITGPTTLTTAELRWLDRNAGRVREAFTKARKDGYPTGKGDGRSNDTTSSTERAALTNLAREQESEFLNDLRQGMELILGAGSKARRLVQLLEHGTTKVEATAEVVTANEYRCHNPACQARVPDLRDGRCWACYQHRRRANHERVPFTAEEQARNKDGTFDTACRRCDGIIEVGA